MSKTDQPRPVPAQKLDRLSAWARRKPRIGLMGEFSSGKSTLLNLLIGENLLPTKVTATELPPVWFSHGRPRAFWVDRQGGHHPLAFGEFGGVPMSARYLRVFAPSPFLERCDLIDTPGISDPNLEEDSWRFAVGLSNFILWCTSATQAWRETERSTWTSLPERLRANSLLVVTRADKLPNAADRDKVARRLARESSGLFGGLVLISTLEAVRGKAALARTGDPEPWAQSGGAELDSRIEAGLGSAAAARLGLLDRYAPRPSGAVPGAPAPEADGAEPLAARSPPPGPAQPVRPRRVERSGLRPAGPGQARSEAAADRSWLDDDPPLRPDSRWATSLGDWAESDLRGGVPAVSGGGHASSIGPAPSTTASAALEAPSIRAAQGPAPQQDPATGGDDPIQAVLAAMAVPYAADPAQPGAEPQDASPTGTLPRAVRLWRDIIRRNPDVPSNDPVLAMIDQLLHELSRDDQPLDETGLTLGPVEQHRAA